MRAAFYEERGAARDVLRVGELGTPQPGPGEVRVRLRTSGVNPSDVKTRGGRTRRGVGFPRIIPHSDGAGDIDRVGEGVSLSRVGERVWIYNGQWKRPFGTAAEFIVLPSEQSVPMPANVDYAAGACFGIPLLTAHRAVTIEGPIDGQTVLVAGGAGAVGHYVIQLARMKGAGVITTVSSEAKAAHARAAGADHTINYRAEDPGSRVKELTGGTGVDQIIEVNLSANAPMIASVLKQFGTVVVYGSDEATALVPALFGIVKSISIRFFIVYDAPEKWRHPAISELTVLLQENRLIHSIGARFPLERIAEAHEAVESGKVMGNVIIDLA